MKTNWFIENSEIPPLGMAIKLLGGSIVLLKNAVTDGETSQIHDLILYSNEVTDHYYKAMNQFIGAPERKDRHLRLGETMLQCLYTIRQNAFAFLDFNGKTYRCLRPIELGLIE